MTATLDLVHDAGQSEDPLVGGLAAARVFEGLNAEQLERLGFASKLRRCPLGRVLMRQGEAPSGLFVVLDGEFAAADAAVGEHVAPPEVFVSGDCFGEGALIDGMDCVPASYHVTATRPSTVIEISGTRLRCTLRGDHELASRVYQNLLRIVVLRQHAARRTIGVAAAPPPPK